MYKVKLTPYRTRAGEIMARQTPGGRLTSIDGRYHFYINEDVPDPDFWVVQGKGLRQPQQACVAPQNTIFLATEPRSVLAYPRSYLRQFGVVVTCQHPTRHPHVVYGPALLPWFIGFKHDAQGHPVVTLDYDHLLATDASASKPRLLSVITSNKAFTRGHIDRIRFVERLKQHFGPRLDVYGHGFRPFDDKWDVLAPYQYHISIENCSEPYYWSEKISDCFLAETYPFYYGCTRLADYFPRAAFTPIDIRRPDQAIDIIEQTIAAGAALKARQALKQSKLLAMQEYNIFEYIARLCDTLDARAPRRLVTLRPCHTMQAPLNAWHYLVSRNYYRALMHWHKPTL